MNRVSACNKAKYLALECETFSYTVENTKMASLLRFGARQSCRLISANLARQAPALQQISLISTSNKKPYDKDWPTFVEVPPRKRGDLYDNDEVKK